MMKYLKVYLLLMLAVTLTALLLGFILPQLVSMKDDLAVGIAALIIFIAIPTMLYVYTKLFKSVKDMLLAALIPTETIKGEKNA